MQNEQYMTAEINRIIADADRDILPEYTLYSHSELLNLNVPPMHWIIEMLIPNPGLVVISGKPGSYKTFFALWLGIRASACLPLFSERQGEHFCKESGTSSQVETPTLFIEEENTIQTMKERISLLSNGFLPDMFHLVDAGFKFKSEAWRTEVLRKVEEKGIKLLILDPFSSVMGLDNENDNAEVSEVMDIIRKQFVKNGLTVILIHHPSKSDGEGKGIRGAGDILGKCDVHLSLEVENEDEKLIRVTYQKLRIADKTKVSDFRIRLVQDAFSDKLSFQYLGKAKEKWIEAQESLANNILRLMELGQDYTRKEVADLVGIATGGSKFTKAWKALLENKRVQKNATTGRFYNNLKA